MEKFSLKRKIPNESINSKKERALNDNYLRIVNEDGIFW